MPAGRPPLKRSAAAPAVQESKRAKKDPLMVGVLDALQQAGDLSEDCRAMLIAAVPGSLGTPAAERHENQALLVTFIGEVVEGLQSKLQAALDAAAAEQAAANSKKAVLDGKVTEAKDILSTENNNAEGKQASMDGAAQAVASAQAKAREAQESQSLGDAKLLEAASDKQMLETALENDIGYLMQDEGFVAAQAAQYVKALLPVAKRIGLDESLLAALPSSCEKPPSVRGAFDGMVLAQLQESLKQHVAKLAAELEAGAESQAKRAEAVTAAQDALGAAESRWSAAAAEVEAVRAQQKQAIEAVREAEAAVEAFVLEGSKQAADHAQKASALTNFINYNVECFKTLRDKTALAGA